MADVQNDEELLSKVTTPESGAQTLHTTNDREIVWQTTDGFPIAKTRT